MSNFIEDYLDYRRGTEVPVFFERWSCISGLAALMGRSCFVTHGSNKIYPNQYIMLVGESGSRKDTAIKAMRKHLRLIDYDKSAPDKSSKEKFLMDLEIGMDKMDDDLSEEAILNVNKGKKTEKNITMRAMFGLDKELDTTPREAWIVAPEWNDFFGKNDAGDFISWLTNMWDYDDIYKNRLKNSKSVRIPYPTINILGGNTNAGISLAFPPEVVGQGFFSRLLMVYADPTGLRITRPRAPLPEETIEITNALRRIQELCARVGHFEIPEVSWNRINEIYQESQPIEDIRFRSFFSRRFTHLLKLSTVCAAAREESYVSPEAVEYANTILHYTEFWMPKALGEFGKAKNSDVVAKILELLDKTDKPLNPLDDIWPQVSRDLDSQKQLQEILLGLLAAAKIQNAGRIGFLPVKKQQKFNFPWCRPTLLKEYNDFIAKERL